MFDVLDVLDVLDAFRPRRRGESSFS